MKYVFLLFILPVYTLAQNNYDTIVTKNCDTVILLLPFVKDENRSNEKKASKKESLLITHYSKMPEFKGDINKYIDNNLVYPQKAKENKIEGRVVVGYTVDSLGNIQHPKIVRSVHPLLDTAALRLFQKMPP